MADRIPQYPMFSQNLMQNSIPQSQIPQQSQQPQQPDPQMMTGLSNPEHSRMWQQQINQLQNQYRAQQSGDLTASQMNHQMQEFARGQALSHGQGQQPIVQQIQQSFGLNSQRMNAPGPVFHDPQANQPQSLIPPNFANMPMGTQQQMKAPFNLNPMMHAAMNNPGVSRQLKMLNQQASSAMDLARLQQPGLGAQHAGNSPTTADMFNASSMQPTQDQMHGSPHPAAQGVGPPGAAQGMVPGNQQQNGQKRMMTPNEFQERRAYLLGVISQSESTLASLLQTARNATSIDPLMQQKLGRLRNDLANQREVYNKFVAAFGPIVSQQMANGMSSQNMPHMNAMASSPSQQPQQAAMTSAQGQAGFAPQASQSVPQQYTLPVTSGPSPMPSHSQAQGSLGQQIPMQPAPMRRPDTNPPPIPPRTGGTPHQLPSQLPSTMSPNLGNFATQPQVAQKPPNQMRQPLGIMPLDKQRFESTYMQFCRSQQFNGALRVSLQDNRTVDLHQLHVQVMREGGAQSVTQRDMWAIIGGRLGFIQFPGTDTEPARCGPGLAQHLQHAYKEYLQHFEHAYVLTVKSRNTTAASQQGIQPMTPLPPSNPMTNSSEMTPNASRPMPNPQLIATAARYAHTSIPDMRAQHVPDQIINFVDSHRAELIKFYQQHHAQLIAKRNGEQEQQNVANGQGQMPIMHEQVPMAIQSNIQRSYQSVGPSGVGMIPAAEPKPLGASLPMSGDAAAALHKLPTQDQIQHAVMTIASLKQVFQQRSVVGMGTQQIPDEQRLEYSQLLAQVHKMTSELDGKLHMYFAVFKNEELLRKYVAIIMTVARQQQLVSTSSPQYIINLMALRNMQMQIHKLNEEFALRWRAIRAAANSQQQAALATTQGRVTPATSLQVPPVQNGPQPTPSATPNGRQVSINSSPAPPPSQLHHPPSHPQVPLQPPLPQSHSQFNQSQSIPQLPKKPFHPSVPSPSVPSASTSITSPTPPPIAASASASTPAASAPTPQTTAGSPQTPKSPPSKAPKTKARAPRKLSTAGKGPATPETAPAPVAGVKRPPEEDVAALTHVAPSEAEAINAPSPKKAKTSDWEGEASEALIKKQQEVENIKTEEDASAFFDRMKELFAMTASTDNEINHDIASSLDQILAGVAQEPADAAATAAALSVHGSGDAGPPPTALSPHTGPANDAFLEYIDFSSFTTLEDEDNDSKAPTPDLVPSSETNLSPESGSEGDHPLGGTASPDKIKIEEPGDRSDPLRLGALREIDGGESAYYQADNWKWEGTMHTLDQPWAMFTS